MGKGAGVCDKTSGIVLLSHATDYQLPAGVEAPETTIPGVGVAADRIVELLQAGEKIAVFADYDPDGTCSAAIMKLALQDYPGQVLWGYANSERGTGLDERFIARAHKSGCRALVSLDLGSGQPAGVQQIRRLGMEAIITDHHHPHAELQADHHLNPQLHTPGHQASGANVAYKLGLEIGRALHGQPQPDFINQGAWLAGFAARADLMDLDTPENSALEALTSDPQYAPPGLLAVQQALQLKSLARSHQGRMAALLNLPKRTPLAQAAWSAGILAAKDPGEADHYIKQLLQVKEQCSKVQRDYLGIAWSGYQDNLGGHIAFATIQEADSHMFAGYAGIVALNYAKTSGHPAVVFIPQNKEGTRFKWSLRTGGADLGKQGALSVVDHLAHIPAPAGFSPAGGHAQAMGGICSGDQLGNVRQAIAEWASGLGLPMIKPQPTEKP